MKVKFKNIKDKVSEPEQLGLAEYHKKFGGDEALRLVTLRSRFNNGFAVRFKFNNRRSAI